MKKLTALLLTFVLLASQSGFAASYNANKVNESHKDFITEAIEKSAFTIEELDEENIFIVENTSYINLKKDIKANSIWVALPILNTDDISYAAFENGEYREAVTNLATFEDIALPYNEMLDSYIADNQLSEPTEITSLWVSERIHLFAYKILCDNIEYIIPINFADFSIYNVTDDAACTLEIGKAYTTEEFVSICEKEATLYDKHLTAEREKENRPTISLDENGDEVVKINGINLDDALELIIERIELMNTGATIKYGVITESDNYITTYRKQKDADVSEVITFAEKLFDELKTQIASGKPSAAQNTSYFKVRDITVNVWSDGVLIEVGKDKSIEFKVKNSAEIIKILDKYATNTFDGFTCEVNDENTPHIKDNIDGFVKTDIIEFEYEIPDDAGVSLTEEVASAGETIKCTFEKYKENKYRSTYILTFHGSIGTVSLYTQVQSSLDGTQELFSNNIPISFRNKYRYENGNLVEYPVGKVSANYKLKLVFTSGSIQDIQEVYLNEEKCKNLKYTRLTEDTKLSEQHVEKDKEVILKQAEECADTLYDFGLFKGTDKGYELDKSLTREESATILVRLLGKEKSIDASDFEQVFSDVDKSRWSYASIMYCYENDITKGTSYNTFSPDTQIDAQQFVTLLMRLLGYTAVNPDTALQKSVEYKLLPSEMAEELGETETFTRSVMVQIVYNSLYTKMHDDTLFSEYLLENGVLTKEDIRQID